MSDQPKSDELKESLEQAILSLAARPRGLRGPFPLDNDELEARAAAILAKRGDQPMHGWQPIETAPRDGTRVDLWFGSYRRTGVWWGRPYHECGGAGRYCDCCPSYDGWADEFGYLSGEESLEDNDPTHWMPLPAPPGSTAEQSDPDQTIADLRAENAALLAALEPSGDTKYAYAGEFFEEIEMPNPNYDEDDIDSDELPTLYVRVPVQWATIKAIMAAIRARAALASHGRQV